MRLILASNSPRRKQMLSEIGLPFTVISSNADESLIELSLNPEQGAMETSRLKAESVYESLSNDMKKDSVILGADTIVVCNGNVLIKPKDEEDARNTLSMLSGRKHQVITGVSIVTEREVESFAVVTDVYFYNLTEDEICAYVETGEPMDKAGSYGIQGIGSLLVEKIDGDYFNVVGLPLSETIRKLEKYGLKVI